MADQFPHQPKALVGNRFSDAYFSALRQQSATQTKMECVFCGKNLSELTRVSNGDLVWCDAAHQELWTRQHRDAKLNLNAVRNGVTSERLAAARDAAMRTGDGDDI